jgi:hypothetical protein
MRQGRFPGLRIPQQPRRLLLAAALLLTPACDAGEAERTPPVTSQQTSPTQGDATGEQASGTPGAPLPRLQGEVAEECVALQDVISCVEEADGAARLDCLDELGTAIDACVDTVLDSAPLPDIDLPPVEVPDIEIPDIDIPDLGKTLECLDLLNDAGDGDRVQEAVEDLKACLAAARG